ncbi:hypothetical protein P3S67_008054 [Capsicum chacoense]
MGDGKSGTGEKGGSKLVGHHLRRANDEQEQGEHRRGKGEGRQVVFCWRLARWCWLSDGKRGRGKRGGGWRRKEQRQPESGHKRRRKERKGWRRLIPFVCVRVRLVEY